MIIKQLKKIPSIDYKYFLDDNRELLAKLLLSLSKNKLEQVFSLEDREEKLVRLQ